LGADLGYTVAANAVLRLVDGESGFFLMMRDDVVLDVGAVRQLVEEMYRSNAGIAGP
jgi:GT2 family glycosyltransferase